MALVLKRSSQNEDDYTYAEIRAELSCCLGDIDDPETRQELLELAWDQRTALVHEKNDWCDQRDINDLFTISETLRKEAVDAQTILEKEHRTRIFGAHKVTADDYNPRQDFRDCATDAILERIRRDTFPEIINALPGSVSFDSLTESLQDVLSNKYPGKNAKISAITRHISAFIGVRDDDGDPLITRKSIQPYLQWDEEHHRVTIGANALILFTAKDVRANLLARVDDDVKGAAYAYKAFNAGTFGKQTPNPYSFGHRYVAADQYPFNCALQKEMDETVEFYQKRLKKRLKDAKPITQSGLTRFEDRAGNCTWDAATYLKQTYQETLDDDKALLRRCPSLPVAVGLAVTYEQWVNYVVSTLSYCLWQYVMYEISKGKARRAKEAEIAQTMLDAKASNQSVPAIKKFDIRRRKLEDAAADVKNTVDFQIQKEKRRDTPLSNKRVEGLRAALERRLIESRIGLARNFVSQVIRDLVPSLVKACRSHSPAIRPDVVIVRNHNSHGVGRSVVLQKGGIPSSVPK